MREAPFGVAIHSSEAPLGIAIQLKQLYIPNCNVFGALTLDVQDVVFNFATKQIYSMTRCAKRRFGIAIRSKRPSFRAKISDVDHLDGLG